MSEPTEQTAHQPTKARALAVSLCLMALVSFGPGAGAQTASDPMRVLTADQQNRVEKSVERALAWLAEVQNDDGSFPCLEIGQPAVTSFGVMAFLSKGYLPGEGPYGETINAAIDYVIDCQKPNGILCKIAPPAAMDLHTASHTGMYNHAISGLMLTEAYGMMDTSSPSRVKGVIEKALEFTRTQQAKPKSYAGDEGGWRYLGPWPFRDSDLSVTGWQLMFYRSAKNAGFEVPTTYVDQAMEFVKRCYNSEHGYFMYDQSYDGMWPTRGMAGSGILALSLGGEHDTEMARRTAEWALTQDFVHYNLLPPDPRTGLRETSRDRYHYGVYYCTQGMYQLGGEYWKRFYPPLVETLLEHQTAAGHWHPEAGEDNRYGEAYTTALMVMVLCTPYQLLPIYQR